MTVRPSVCRQHTKLRQTEKRAKLILVPLAQHCQAWGFAFWNLPSASVIMNVSLDSVYLAVCVIAMKCNCLSCLPSGPFRFGEPAHPGSLSLGVEMTVEPLAFWASIASFFLPVIVLLLWYRGSEALKRE